MAPRPSQPLSPVASTFRYSSTATTDFEEGYWGNLNCLAQPFEPFVPRAPEIAQRAQSLGNGDDNAQAPKYINRAKTWFNATIKRVVTSTPAPEPISPSEAHRRDQIALAKAEAFYPLTECPSRQFGSYLRGQKRQILESLEQDGVSDKEVREDILERMFQIARQMLALGVTRPEYVRAMKVACARNGKYYNLTIQRHAGDLGDPYVDPRSEKKTKSASSSAAREMQFGHYVDEDGPQPMRACL